MTNLIETFPLTELVIGSSIAMVLKLNVVKTNSQVMLMKPSLGLPGRPTAKGNSHASDF